MALRAGFSRIQHAARPPTLVMRAPLPQVAPASRRAASSNYIRFGPQAAQFARSRGIPTRYIVGVGAGGLALWVIFHLERVPQTGRWRLMSVSESTMMGLSESSEKQLASQFGSKFLPDGHPVARRVQGISQRLLTAGGLLGPDNKVKWRVKVIDDKSQVNAFVIPSGLICVFSGLLDVCDVDAQGRRAQNDSALAAVLGHEISHQIARHGAERMSGGILVQIAGLLGDLSGIDPYISRTGLNLFASLPFSRAAENEADHLGLRLMAQACFDPREAPDFWKRMEDQGVPEFLSTHPSHKNRTKRLTAWIPEALEKRPASCGQLDDYADNFATAFRSM